MHRAGNPVSLTFQGLIFLKRLFYTFEV